MQQATAPFVGIGTGRNKGKMGPIGGRMVAAAAPGQNGPPMRSTGWPLLACRENERAHAAVSRWPQRACWFSGGCCPDFGASIATEDPKRRLGGGCLGFAFVRHRHAANFAFWR